jgi:GT2 family glycosyltransferase
MAVARDAAPLPVSVVIPAYNAADTLRRALTGIARQHPARPAEVIVVDDGSADTTAEVAEVLGAKVIRGDRNRGPAAARNAAIASSSQPWLAFLDSDDEWLPHHLELLWKIRDSHVLVATSALRCGPDPADDLLDGPALPEPLLLRDPGRLLAGNMIGPSATMVRRDVVERVGGFRKPDGTEDLDLWLRVLEQGTGIVDPTVSVLYHLSAGQISGDYPRMQAGRIQVAERFRNRWWWSERLNQQWHGHAAWTNVRAAVRAQRPFEAMRTTAWIAARPSRVGGAIRSRIARARKVRRSARIGRDGGRSVAVLPRGQEVRARALAALDGRPIVDLGERRGVPLAYWHLLRRPTAEAIAESELEGLLLRAVGVRSPIQLRELEAQRASASKRG